jgi:hypothetical protein
MGFPICSRKRIRKKAAKAKKKKKKNEEIRRQWFNSVG